MSTSDDSSLNALLNQGIAACQAGDLTAARQALIAALKIDPNSETGWLWLSSALTAPAERRACLQRLLAINPNHQAARNGLRWLDERFPPGKPPAAEAETEAEIEAEAEPPAAPEPEPEPEPEPAAESEPEPPALEQTLAEVPPLAAPQTRPLSLDDLELLDADAPEPAAAKTSPFSADVVAAMEAEETQRPDWLDAALQRAGDAPTESAAAEDTEAQPAAKPDWLTAALQPSAEIPAAPPAGADKEAKRPSWLDAALQRAEEVSPRPAGAEHEPDEEADEAETLIAAAPVRMDEEEEAAPDWLTEVNQPDEAEDEAGDTLVASAATYPEVRLDDQAAPVYAPRRTRPDATECPWCNSPISSLDETCPTCHRPLEFECPNCNYGVPLEEPQCPNCQRPTGDFYNERQVYLRDLGQAYLEKQDYKKALVVYRNLVEIAPDVIPYQAGLMEIYVGLGQTEHSIPAAQHILELDPANEDALDRVGRWYAVQGDFEPLAEIVTQLEGMKNRSPRMSLLLGDLEFERRQYPAAFRAYRQAVAKPDFDPPTLARLHYRLGEMYLVAEDTIEALHAFRDAVAVDVEIHEVELARKRIEQLRPPLPPSAMRGASETLRAMAGPLLLVWLTGAIQVGLRFSNLNAAMVVGFFAAVPGSYLVASAVSTPTAIEWRTMLGEQGLSQSLFGAIVALLGAAIITTSVVLILFGS